MNGMERLKRLGVFVLILALLGSGAALLFWETGREYLSILRTGRGEADYLLYLAAREIADGENEDPEKRNGSIDQAEAQAAIDMLTGLSDEGRAYLWQSTNKGWSEEKNPYR